MSDPAFSAARIARLQALFDAALDLPPGERLEAVISGAPDDPDLQAEVLALLSVHDDADGRLVSPISPALLQRMDPTADRWTGTRVGAFEIGRLIGSGGMGSVYEAVRADDQYQQRVAIKLLRRDVEGESAVRRFRIERQILANLNHPNIASLLDGGTTADGKPYIVMEYVDGTPIDAWADRRRLSIRARVELLAQVCAAVQYAHQKLVIHRDLKPANILVTEDGVVKLLDFGIAKLLSEPGTVTAEAPPTRVGFRVLTPEYAAPEQFSGGAVGTASDVYALGVVLFELLTGRRPLELGDDRSIGEVEAAIRDQAPSRPSTVLVEGRWRAMRERTERQARAHISGDLDAITLMALRKEPDRRYGTAAQLGEDLRRYLDGRPVHARPDGFTYRAMKLVRRRRIEVAAAAIAVISLLGGMVATAGQARRAETEHQRMVEVTSFLTSMLGAADPAALGRDVTVREVLDSASVRATSLVPTPELEGDIRAIIGDAYLALGEYAAAEAQYRAGLAARTRHAPRGDLATAEALARLAGALELVGELPAADSILDEAFALLDTHPPESDVARAGFLDGRGRVLVRLGRIREADPFLREALAINLSHRPRNDSAVSYAYANLAVVLSESGDHAGADSLYRSALTAARRVYGEEHPLVASVMSAHATVLDRLGEWDAAEATLREVSGMRRRMLGPEHPDYAWTVFNHADHLVRGGRYAEGAAKAREVLALRGRSVPDTHPAVAVAMQVLGRALAGMDSLPEAGYWVRESLDVRRATLPPDHWLILSSESVLGEHLALEGRFEEAEGLLLAAERDLVVLRGEGSQVVDDVRRRIVTMYRAWGRTDDAATWEARLGTPD